MPTERTTADFIIVGGGIAGASAGYELSRLGRVVLLERESQPGYHTTGRSSAIFQTSFQKADPLIHALVRASEAFLRRPPRDFTGHSLLKPRPLLYIATPEEQPCLDELYRKLSAINVAADFVDEAAAVRLLPVLAPAYRQRALYEEGLADIDVNALHDGYLRAIKAAGGRVITRAEVTALSRSRSRWHVTSTRGDFAAPVVINAAGAWVDQLAGLAGLAPINIQPLRRTVIMMSPPEDIVRGDETAAGNLFRPPLEQWPLVMAAKQGFYFKPDSGKILMTPGDERLCPPSDARPEEIDIAYAAHYLQQATSLKVDKIDHSWAGLRNYVADRHPVVGFDPEGPGFFWLAGQGGFGIKTAPALGRVTAALVAGHGLPDDMTRLGLREEQISVRRIK